MQDPRRAPAPASSLVARQLGRRRFVVDLGRGVLGIAVLGIAACAPGDGRGASSSPSARPAPGSSDPGPTPVGDPTDPASSVEPGVSADPGSTDPDTGVTWQRVDLGFVSAYVLIREGEVAIVDTGVAGSESAIETVLQEVGLGWAAVSHVILTHQHPDHAGSIAAVLERAAEAVGYAGAADLPAIVAPRALVAVADGDDIFGLRIVATPGHTPGHIAVLDPVGGMLVAGDALGTANGGVTGPNAQFTADMATAEASVRALAALSFETLLVGHGEPVTSGASALVAELAAGG